MTDRADLSARILRFLREHPGSTTTAVRTGVSGSVTRIRDALEELEDAGEVKNGGNGRGHRWRVAERDANGVLWPADVEGRPREIEGVRIRAWMPPKVTAACLGTSPRTLQRWEEKGLPSIGRAHRKLHPFPHVLAWAVTYAVRQEEQTGAVRDLPLREALARHHAAEVEAGREGLFGVGIREESGAPE